MFKRLNEDIRTILDHDPAARTWLEVLLCYPGLHAIIYHRLAHGLWRRGFRLAARLVAHIGKMLTAVEIHPAARVGRRVFIDHATGVVIGETAVVGDDVTLYQGVTLGGTSLDKGKRHPTLENGVIVGSGAQILGPHVIGEGARVGANAVVLADVPAGMTVVGIPARVVMRKKASDEDFCAYGTPVEGIKDPVARTVRTLHHQMREMLERIDHLESRLATYEDPAARAGDEAPQRPRLMATGTSDAPRHAAGER
ncbi:serine O-acetyltransferase [Roseospirillum parvum]|uniref:Serine acetyltransferase n=1 Tax=Roseospirillum parvum TaxID=83401 RepID=A0A1G7XVZ3_9PROT|nr:serine O-acetyltransferase [Roseospirillum parvum]SDG88304.1 serine O-acetyltransferase [Roseospirillum parvum]